MLNDYHTLFLPVWYVGYARQVLQPNRGIADSFRTGYDTGSGAGAEKPCERRMCTLSAHVVIGGSVVV